MKPLHIGLLVDEINNKFSQKICAGAVKACHQIGAQLSIFFGGYLRNTYQEYGYQKNMIYPIGNTKDLDFLIVSISSICRDSANKKFILDYFDKVPMITLTQRFDGKSAVLIDNEKGLYEAIEYIVENCKEYRSFAMVAGSVNNFGSNMRKSVFENVLRKHGLEEEIYVEHAKLMERISLDTIRKVFRNKPSTNVLICANDELAVGAYKVCEEMGKIVGKDVLILGFDDIHEASCLQPGLASIRSPIEELGYEAVIQGVMRKDIFTCILPTQFILRKSLGDFGFNERPLQDCIVRLCKREITFDDFWQFVQNSFHVEFPSLKRMLETLHYADLSDMETYDLLQKQLHDFLASDRIQHVDTIVFIRLLQQVIFYEIAFGYFDEESTREQAKIKCESIAFQIISQLNSNLMEMENLRYAEKLQVNNMARSVMMFKNQRECHENILTSLSQLGIRNAQVYTFKQEVMCESYVDLPKQVSLISQIKDGKKEYFNDQKSVFIEDIMGQTKDWQTNQPIGVFSLYSNAKLFGYLLCDIELSKYSELEFLTIHIGTSLQMLQLMMDFQNQSRIDVLTGLYNRRGMENTVDGYLRSNQDKSLYILMADIDNLKMINDSFGHKAGDIAIQKCAKILRLALGEEAFLVRMGGDEFLSIFSTDCIEHVEACLEQAQLEINNAIQQPVMTSVSYGVKKIEDIGRLNLDELTRQADVLMYQNKQRKKRNRE